MVESPAFLSERLQSEGEKVLAFFRELTSGQWEQPLYLDAQRHEEGSEWRVRDVLAHFVAAEESFIRLLTDVAAGGAGAPPDFDIDRFNRQTVAKSRPLSTHELMQQFDELRAQTVQMVVRLEDRDLAREGRHPFLGMAPLGDMIKLIYRHNQLHLRDVRRLFSPIP